MAGSDHILSHQLDLFRLEAGVRARVLRLLGRLQEELSSQIARGSAGAATKARLRSLLRQAGETVDHYYARVRDEVEPALERAGEAQAAHVAEAVIATADASLPTETFLSRLASGALVQGAPSSEWWRRQSRALALRFADVVRSGAAAGQTSEQIVARVAGSAETPGIMETARANARALVHSSIQTVANAARMETFRQNDDVVKGVRQLSTFDEHTTDTCVAYDGEEWDLDGEPLNGTTLPFVNDGGSADGVPRHWNCRSVLVPITATFRELGVDADEPDLPERPGGARTMDEWLAGRTEEQLDDQLGKGRADLYRRGVITRAQLLNLSGNPLTADQLARKYARRGA